MYSTKLVSKNFLFQTAAWCILLLSFLCYYANPNVETFHFLFNSDTLVLPNFYKDLVIENGLLSDWYYAATPTLFPDVSLYFLIAKLFHLNFISAGFMYGLIQIVLIVFLCAYIYRKSVPDSLKKYSWLVPLLFSIFFMESYYFSHDSMIGFFLLSYSYHMCPFVNSLITIAIFLSALPKLFKYIFFIAFSSLAAFSDMLYLVTLVAPLLVTLVVTINRKNSWMHVWTAICILIGAAAGMLGLEYIKLNPGFYHIAVPHKIFAFDNIYPSLVTFCTQMFDNVKVLGFKTFQIIFTFLSILLCGAFAIFKRKKLPQGILFLLSFYTVFSICVLSAPIINGNYSGYDTLRYNVSPFYFSIVILVLLIAYLFENKMKSLRAKTIGQTLIVVVFLFLTMTKYSTTGLRNYFNFYPQTVKEIDEACKKNGLTYGVAEYWTARYTTMFSKNNIKVLSVFDTANLYEMGSNIQWYYQNVFDFVIANNMDDASLLKYFSIRDTVETSEHRILVVDKFIFPEGQYFPMAIGK
jgi:hypothetical protein